MTTVLHTVAQCFEPHGGSEALVSDFGGVQPRERATTLWERLEGS